MGKHNGNKITERKKWGGGGGRKCREHTDVTVSVGSSVTLCVGETNETWIKQNSL